MKMYVWSGGAFLAVAHAETVQQARKLALEEIGTPVKSSSPQMKRAWEVVNGDNPTIYQGQNAEFTLTDSAMLEEADEENERLKKALQNICAITASHEGEAPTVRTMIEITRICNLAGITTR